MALIGQTENAPATARDAYKHLGKTDLDMLGAGNMFIKSEMVTCCWCISIVDEGKRPFMNAASRIAPYPNNCEKCTRAALCSEFLQRVDYNLNSATRYDPQLILKGEHTGWENLKWAQNYRSYRGIDSLEDAYPRK